PALRSAALAVSAGVQGSSPCLHADGTTPISTAESDDACATVPCQHATEGTSAALTGISITDADATGNVTVTFSVAHGSLTMNTRSEERRVGEEGTNNGSSYVPGHREQ